jgi:hypothetical protein
LRILDPDHKLILLCVFVIEIIRHDVDPSGVLNLDIDSLRGGESVELGLSVRGAEFGTHNLELLFRYEAKVNDIRAESHTFI